MIYRSYNYREKVTKPVGQTFDREVPTYELDIHKHILVETGKKDLQAFVQSSADCALSKILEKYGTFPTGSNLPEKVISSDDVYVADMKDDLLSMGEMFEEFEVIREHYGFGADVPYQTMFEQLQKRSVELSDYIKKGGVPDETQKNKSPQVGEAVPQDGQKNS